MPGAAATAKTATIHEEMTTTMDLGTNFLPEEDDGASAMQVSYIHGRMSVAVAGNAESTPARGAQEGRWQMARRKMRRQEIGAAGGESVPVVSAPLPPPQLLETQQNLRGRPQLS